MKLLAQAFICGSNVLIRGRFVDFEALLLELGERGGGGAGAGAARGGQREVRIGKSGGAGGALVGVVLSGSSKWGVPFSTAVQNTPGSSFDILDPVFQAKMDAMWENLDNIFPEFTAWRRLRETSKNTRRNAALSNTEAPGLPEDTEKQPNAAVCQKVVEQKTVTFATDIKGAERPENDVGPDKMESKTDPDKTESETDPDKTESETDPDKTESETDPDKTESETD
ncbi:hypothetical protein HYPSUDRAFT_206474 [Hypholoma sublateritium FD-334 SS-4]|uniref:Uncharacterized protein n=1 Tax=Hypholoma sublateritium (strain FD-334 SS-4) TaxID=945553 RepID=A0A0D2KR48_HYPSF|nr:hypothetical protein HYPSUDRAFT_206474 [Hypholoma sublateritium FD-334 SS-4]